MAVKTARLVAELKQQLINRQIILPRSQPSQPGQERPVQRSPGRHPRDLLQQALFEDIAHQPQ